MLCFLVGARFHDLALPGAAAKEKNNLCSLSLGTDKFNDWGGRECNIFFPVLGRNGTKIAPTGDTFDQPSGQMR